MMPEWPVPAPASPQTHVALFDIPGGPAPVLWPFQLHSVNQVGDTTGTRFLFKIIEALESPQKNMKL